MDIPNNVNGLEQDSPTLVLSPAVYDKLRLTVQVLLPALATLYFALGGVWDWSNVEGIVATITALTTFLGLILAASRKRYMNSDARFDGVVQPTVDGGGLKAASLEVSGDPEHILANQSELRLKVLPPIQH